MEPASPSAPTSYAQTPRTTGSPATRAAHGLTTGSWCTPILDEGYVCHLGFVRDGAPVVLPTLYARVGERLYVHGSTGSRPLREAGGEDSGLPVCVTVTHLDGLVLARSAFHHSVNYRSVVAHGTRPPGDRHGGAAVALDAIVDNVVPGRAADSRRATRRSWPPPPCSASTWRRSRRRSARAARRRTRGPRPPYWSGVSPSPRLRRPDPGGRPRAGHARTRLPPAR